MMLWLLRTSVLSVHMMVVSALLEGQAADSAPFCSELLRQVGLGDCSKACALSCLLIPLSPIPQDQLSPELMRYPQQ